MKVLVLDTMPIRRGAQVFVAELCEQLECMGIATQRIYLYSYQGEVPIPLRSQDRVLGFDSAQFSEKLLTLNPFLLIELTKILSKQQPDLVLLNGARALKYGAWLKVFGQNPRMKFVGRFIDDAVFWNPGLFKTWYYRSLLNRLDGVVGVSKASLDSMIRHYGFGKPSEVIHRTFDPVKFAHAPSRREAREQLGLGMEEEVILFLGNLTTQKRPDRFLEVLQKLWLTRPSLKALIVGDGPMRKELEDQVADIQKQETSGEKQETRGKRQEGTIDENDSKKSNGFNLSSYVYFTGYQQDVSPYLAAADLLVLTSDTEGMPGVVLEAAYFEVPTVASAVGGIAECIQDGVTGFLVGDRSVEGFIEKIDILFSHSYSRMEMGKQARMFVDQNFKMEQVTSRFLEFVQFLLVKR